MSPQSTIFFNRIEIKYLVDRTTRTALTRDLAAFMRPDLHAGTDGSYQVRSLYFDTHDYSAYFEKMAGEATRHKLRIRAYGEDPAREALVRLEVKSRYLSYVRKITVDVSREDYAAIECALKHRLLPPADIMYDGEASQEFFRIQKLYNMEPKILIQYRRQAFERVEINRTRVNFDDELLATRTLDLLGPLTGARRLLDHGHAIFEIKVDNVLPYWLHMLIAKYDLQNEAVSKYCFSIQSESRSPARGREQIYA
jgi:hypothetical protein